ncbi:MAG: hypothetical protein ACYS3N_05810 [Planctomycetota bacterium]|jgi:hypothetical protein
MNRRRLVKVVIVIAVAAIAGTTATYALAQTRTRAVPHGQMAKMDMKHSMTAKTLSLEKIHSENLPIALLSVDKAAKAIESGNEKAALAELQKAKRMLMAIHAALGKHVKPQFVNNRCPIMGSPINPAKVTKNLVRDYMGQKVAFCCAGCPSTWDKLPNAQKQAKLAKAKPAPSQIHTTHKH